MLRSCMCKGEQKEREKETTADYFFFMTVDDLSENFHRDFQTMSYFEF